LRKVVIGQKRNCYLIVDYRHSKPQTVRERLDAHRAANALSRIEAKRPAAKMAPGAAEL